MNCTGALAFRDACATILWEERISLRIVRYEREYQSLQLHICSNQHALCFKQRYMHAKHGEHTSVSLETLEAGNSRHTCYSPSTSSIERPLLSCLAIVLSSSGRDRGNPMGRAVKLVALLCCLSAYAAQTTNSKQLQGVSIYYPNRSSCTDKHPMAIRRRSSVTIECTLLFSESIKHARCSTV